MSSVNWIKNFNFKIFIIRFIKTLVLLILFLYIAQTFFAHRHKNFYPDYEKINLEQILQKDKFSQKDYETLFLQTGLSQTSVRYLKNNDDNYNQTIKQYQDYFFDKKDIKCKSILWIITKEDVINNINTENKPPPLIGARPGDILVTTSTHTAGWRHGHSALVIRNGRTLECAMLGSNSEISRISDWQRYSNYALLRVKNASTDYGLSTAEFAYNELVGIPYHLSCGLIGKKAPDLDTPYFGLNCGYLVWYAWQEKNVDIDSDGGRIVTPNDILQSDELEVIQIYGMDPRNFR